MTSADRQPGAQGLAFATDFEAAAWCARTRRESLLPGRRRAAFAELARVFLAAPAPQSITGNTDIVLVATPLGLPADVVVRLFFNTRFWLHKKFDPAEGRGINGFAEWFRPLAPLVFPKGGFSAKTDPAATAGPGRLWGVRFANRRAQSLVFPGKEVFTIDYRSPGTTLAMRTAVDEAVQISPNRYLCLGLAEARGRAAKLLWFVLAQEPLA